MQSCVPRDPSPGELARAPEAIGALFERMRDAFVAAGLERCAEVDWSIERPSKSHTRRHFASCRMDGLLVSVQTKLVLLEEEQQLGILAHELGHAADFLYPAELRVVRSVLLHREPSPRDERAWRGRDIDRLERDADGIARAVLGEKRGYTGSCQLQTLGRGRYRPSGLR
jgi:hypothetical protein